MGRRRFSRFAPLLACGTLATLAASEGTAEASGYLAARFGSDHGHPAAANPYAVYFNPAAMGGTTGTQLTIDATLALRVATYERGTDALSASNARVRNDPAYIEANTGKARIQNLLGFPMLAFITDLGGKLPLRLGYSVYIPYGGVADWKRNSRFGTDTPEIGANDGPQRWHNISGMLLSLYNTAAVSMNIGKTGLSLGANFSVIYHSLETLRARNLDSSDDTQGANGGLVEGRSHIKANAINVGAAFGVYYRSPDARLQLGFSYTSRPGFSGDIRYKGQLKQQFGGTKEVAPTADADFLQGYPDLFRLGGSYLVSDKVELRLDAEVVRWSFLKRQCVVTPGKDCNVNADGSDNSGNVTLNVPRDWNDAFAIRGGVGYFVTNRTELFGSFGFGTPAAPKATMDASTIDSQRLNFSAGVKHEFTKKLGIAASYNHVYFLPVDTRGENRLFEYLAPSKSPSAAGQYASNIFFVNANMTYKF